MACGSCGAWRYLVGRSVGRWCGEVAGAMEWCGGKEVLGGVRSSRVFEWGKVLVCGWLDCGEE